MISSPELRRDNLRLVLHDLEQDNVTTSSEKAKVLGVTECTLFAVLSGFPISDELAREIEWASHKPSFWLDENHSGGMPM